MPQPKFTTNDFVLFKEGIYKITRVNDNQSPISYFIEILAYIENSNQGIDINIPKTASAQESELRKFEYAPPRYPIGKRFSDGDEVYLAIFLHNTHTYRYNLSGSGGAVIGLLEEDLAWK